MIMVGVAIMAGAFLATRALAEPVSNSVRGVEDTNPQRRRDGWCVPASQRADQYNLL